MDINTVADLLHELSRVENERLLEEKIVHRPTIGDMYEGLTQELLNKSIFTGLNLCVAKGSFIKGCDKEMDIILAEGEGEMIPYTNAYRFDPRQVIAVIQVKKTFRGKEIRDSYENLKEIADLYKDVTPEGYMLKMAEDSLHNTLHRCISDYDNGLLTPFEEYIRHSLITQALLPVTIVIGYNGLKSEYSVREKYYEFLKQNISAEGKFIKGFGPANFPLLVICEETCLIKLMGCPFCSIFDNNENGWWDFVGSSHYNPMYFFLETIWTKLSYKYHLPVEIFGEDLETPKIVPFLACHAHEKNGHVIGWDYYYHCRSREELDEINGTVEWSPIELNFLQFRVMLALCNNGELKIEDIIEPKEEYEKYGFHSREELLDSIYQTGLVAQNGDRIVLITRMCQVAMIDGQYYAGENNTGRFSNWLQAHSLELMSNKSGDAKKEK